MTTDGKVIDINSRMPFIPEAPGKATLIIPLADTDAYFETRLCTFMRNITRANHVKTSGINITNEDGKQIMMYNIDFA